MVPVKPVKADLLTELKQTIYVPIATKQTYGSVKIGDGFTVDNGVINFDKSEVTILSISLNGELLNIDDNKNVNIILTKNDVGLDQVDNTSDKDKPISNAQQEALNRKLDKKQSLSEVGKFLYISDDGDIDFKNVDTIKVKLNNETIDAGAGIFNFSNNFVVTSVAGGQVDIDLSEEFKESVGKIDSISLNGVPQTIDVNKNVNLVIPIDDKLDKSHADRDVITNQTISINGDNVSLVNSYINLNSLVTKTQSNKISLANDNQAGLMSISDYKSIRDLQARVGQLEQKATRLLYDEKLYPTADEINTFVTSMGYVVPFEGIAVVVSGTNHIWHYYEGGTGWKDDGVDVVSQFTNDVAGIIKGSAIEGKIYAETDGTGSVYGWDSLINRVNDAEDSLAQIDLSEFVNKTKTDGYATGFIKNFEDSSGIKLVVDGMSTYSNGVSLTLRSGGIPSISFGSYSSTYSVGFNLDNAKNVFSGPLYNLRDSEWEGESIPTVADDDKVVVKGDLADYYTKIEIDGLLSPINTNITNILNNTVKISNSGGGFSAGQGTIAAYGGVAIGLNATTGSGGGALGREAEASTSGGAVGSNSSTSTGGSVGGYTSSEGGGAIGDHASTGWGGAVGSYAHANNGGAVGMSANTGNGFAGGRNAKAQDAEGNGIDAIQLGAGTNTEVESLQVYDYKLMTASGKVPDERLNDTVLLSTDTLVLDGGTSTITTV